MYLIDFITGTSPFTYATQQVRPGENQVRVRAKCPGQTGSSEVQVLHIGKLTIIIQCTLYYTVYCTYIEYVAH